MTGPVYSFSYDANGNITNDSNRSFTYASFDKLTFISKSGTSSSMWYGVDRELYYKEESYLEGDTASKSSGGKFANGQLQVWNMQMQSFWRGQK